MVLSFDDLFALRLYYLDEINDEVEIIKILKLKLLENGMEENEVNKYLSDFYKNSGIEISENSISEIVIPVNNLVFVPVNFINFINNLMQQDQVQLDLMEDVKVTIKKEELEKFTKIKLEKDEDKCCSICLCDYKKDEEKIILKCNHDFHYDCIRKWLEEYNYKCPICRTETTEIKNVNINQDISESNSNSDSNSNSNSDSDSDSD